MGSLCKAHGNRMKETMDRKPGLGTGVLPARWSIQDLYNAWAWTLREESREATPQLIEINLIQDEEHGGGQDQHPLCSSVTSHKDL